MGRILRPRRALRPLYQRQLCPKADSQSFGLLRGVSRGGPQKTKGGQRKREGDFSPSLDLSSGEPDVKLATHLYGTVTPPLPPRLRKLDRSASWPVAGLKMMCWA